jgi:uncharacterized membrane protein
MEAFTFILFVLTVIMLSLLFSIKRKIDLFNIDSLSLQGRLDMLKKEIESLIRQVKEARGEQKTEQEPEHKACQPPPEPVTEPVFPAQAKPAALSTTVAIEAAAITSTPASIPMPAPHEIRQGREICPDTPQGPAPEPSRWAQSVRAILGRIWRWILVGEEYRPQGVTMEYAVATTWLMRAGIIAVVTCVGYFLKWSIDRELIAPMGRVAISIVFGVAGLLWGLRLLGRRWNILGQGFVGGGLATLYFSMFATGPMYHLLPISAVFLLMILVTVTAGLLSIRTDSLLIAIFGIMGGFCTPILLSTEQPNLMALYGYLLLLSIGILGIAHYKQWRLLNYLGFIFTYMIYFGSLHQYQPSDFIFTVTFLALFFVIHSLLVFIYNARRAVKSTVLEVIYLVLNAGLFSASAYDLIRDAVGRPYPAIMTLALAVFYAGQVAVFLRRRLVDRRLLTALIALAGLFATLTLPLAVEKESLTIGLSLLALTFLWLGRRLESNFIRHLGYLLYGIVFFRILFMDIPRNFVFYAVKHSPIAVYWQALGHRLWTFGIAIGAVAAGFAIETRRARSPANAGIDRGNDVPSIIPSPVSGQIFFWGAILCGFVFLQFECNTLFGYFTSWKPAALTMLWCAMAAYFLRCYRQGGKGIILAGLFVFLGVAVLKTLMWDMDAWCLCGRCYFNMAYTPLIVLARWVDFMAVLVLSFAGWFVLDRATQPPTALRQSASRIFGYGALALLFLYLSLEINSLLYWNLREFQAGGISILWTLFAIGFVSGGIWKNVKLLRYLGLALFAVVVGKVFLLDLEHMPIIYRVVAFLVVGIALLLGSFAYLYSARKFKQKDGNEQIHAGESS